MWHDVSAVGANAIAEWAWSRHRLKLFIIVVPHTFGGALVFKPHLHLMVSAGGLNLSTDRWHDSIEFFEDEIMQAWRFALTDYLRASIRSGSTFLICHSAQSKQWRLRHADRGM